MQKDKTVQQTSSPVEESKSGESPPAALNSAVQSLCSDKSLVAPVDRVGEARSKLAVERELRKQVDAGETEACNQKLNSTVAQECGKKTVVERRDAACVVVGSPCSFSCLRAHLPECGNSSTAQKDKTVRQTSSPVEESKSGESPPAALNSAVQSLCSDKSLLAPRVGEARSKLAVEQELRKQLDAGETGACNRKLNSTVTQECGKRTVVERRDAACVINPSFVTSPESVKKPHLKEIKVRLKRLSSSLIEKYTRLSNFTETDVSSERTSDNAVSHLEQTGTVQVSNLSSVVLPADTDRPSSCDTSSLTHAPVNTALGAGEGNTLVSTTDCMVLGRKS